MFITDTIEFRGSGDTWQSEKVNLCARLVEGLQRSARGVAADEAWRRFQEHLVLAVLRQTTPVRHLHEEINIASIFDDSDLPGPRTLALEDVGAVKSSVR